MNNDFARGIAATVVVLLITFVVVFLTTVFSSASTVGDCENYGKFKSFSNGAWYKCSKMEQDNEH